MEINSNGRNGGNNGNMKSVSLTLMGTVGILQEGMVNHDGLGVILFFIPKNLDKTTVIGGTSAASQDSLTKVLGLG